MFLEPLAASALYLQVSNRPVWCEPKRAPEVTVNLKIDPIETDFRKSLDELQHVHIDTKNPYGAHADTLVGGLTSGPIEVRQNISLGGVRTSSDDQYCVWYDKVVVHIRLSPTVVVAKDFDKKSCRFKAIWNHEMKHVKVDNEIVRRYRPRFEQAIAQAMNERGVTGPFTGTKRNEAVQDEYKALMERAIAEITKRMDGERQKRQQAVDSRDEYDYVSSLCPHEPMRKK